MQRVLKKVIAFIVAASLPLTSSLHADPSIIENTENGDSEEIHVTHVKPEVKHVGKASSDGMSAAKSRQIQNIALAAGIIAIAVTTLVLVNNHHGHHRRSHGNNHD